MFPSPKMLCKKPLDLSDMARRNVRIIVSGMVQGVGFRYFVYREAVQLGLTGYTQNLPSGQVEIVVSGERGMVNDLVKTVQIGPRYASVSQVVVEEVELKDPFADFRIR